MTGSGNNIRDWPLIVKLLDDAGRSLKKRYGNQIPRQALIDEVQARGKYKPDSIIPTDYCYNSINAALISCRHCLFQVVGRGYFRHLGPNFPYNGEVFWKGRPVGRWTNGFLHLDEDPRRA